MVMAAVPETMISLQYGSQSSYLRLRDIASLVRLGIVFEGPWVWRVTESGVNGKVKRGMTLDKMFAYQKIEFN